METVFKAGDWIIATKAAMRQENSGGFMGGLVSVPNRQFMDKPIKVVAVTEAHLVYEWLSWSDNKPRQSILPLEEVEERAFIIAAPELVAVVTQNERSSK
jgi:hypothetical protein